MENINEHIPIHVAVIPDGNRRWAKEKGLDPWDGHDAGAKMIEKIARKARSMGIRHVSLWGSSKENLAKRPFQERHELLRVYTRYFKKLIDSDEIMRDEVRLNVIGEWRGHMPKELVDLLEFGIRKTRSHARYNLNFFLNYSGDDEMCFAIKKICLKNIDSEKITKDLIKKNLYTCELPPVDLLIRTGGEPHLSAGFMMWDIANAQLFFSPKYFPDFDDIEFEKAIHDYGKRIRRHGA